MKPIKKHVEIRQKIIESSTCLAVAQTSEWQTSKTRVQPAGTLVTETDKNMPENSPEFTLPRRRTPSETRGPPRRESSYLALRTRKKKESTEKSTNPKT